MIELDCSFLAPTIDEDSSLMLPPKDSEDGEVSNQMGSTVMSPSQFEPGDLPPPTPGDHSGDPLLLGEHGADGKPKKRTRKPTPVGKLFYSHSVLYMV